MPSFNRRLIFNTRERLLSGDLNDMTALLHTKSTDEIVSALTGDSFNGVNPPPISGVVSGGIVSANGTTLIVSVSPILAFKLGTPATGLDSNYIKIQTLTATTIDLAPFVDPLNPRWIAIEVAGADSAELVSARDIFNPALGTFTVVNVDKIRRPEAAFTVTAGVPSPTPVLPLGNPLVMPLAYVFLDASATSIPLTDVIPCRPILSPRLAAAQATFGGGITVPAAGGSAVSVLAAQHQSLLTGLVLRTIGTTVQAGISGDPNWYLGQGYPAGEVPVYVYAIAAPFPAGYDADISDNREFLDLSGRIPSNPTISALNGLVAFSTDAPSISSTGLHPALPFSVNDPTFNGGSTANVFYLGAVSKQNIAPAGFAQQTTRDKRVRFLETAKLGEDFETESGTSTVLAAGNLTNRVPLLVNNTGKGLATCFPQAYEWDVLIESRLIAANIVAAEIRGSEEPLSGPPTAGVYVYLDENADVSVRRDRRQYQLRTNLLGAFTWSSASTGVGTFELRVVTQGYLDPVLALR